jgi:hypothetical protein
MPRIRLESLGLRGTVPVGRRRHGQVAISTLKYAGTVFSVMPAHG